MSPSDFCGPLDGSVITGASALGQTSAVVVGVWEGGGAILRPPVEFRPRAWDVRPTHANGAVTVAERRLIRSSSSIRVINVVTSSMHLQRATATTVFALLVRNSRRVVGLSIARRCWRRPAALRAHRRRGLQPSRSPLASRLVLELAHLALAVRHRAPAYVPSPCSVVSCLRRPRSCCRCAGGAHRGGRNRPT